MNTTIRSSALLTLLSVSLAVSAAPQASSPVIARPASDAVGSRTLGPYVYDGSGNILNIGGDTYTYDDVGRIRTVTSDGTPQQSYGYDSFGNLTSLTNQAGARCTGGRDCGIARAVASTTNRLAESAGVTEYDGAGNLVRLDASYQYTYDAAGMMTATGGSAPRQFIYTVDDERIATRAGTQWNWTVRDLKGAVLSEFTSQDSATTAQWTEDYVYRGASLLAANLPQGRRHFHLDHLGTPRLITDDAGRQLGLHKYLPFGAELDLGQQENPEDLHKFTGHERDVLGDTHELDYMHARYYGSAAGRFFVVDPKNSAKPTMPQSWDRYTYALDNPLKYVDPDGQDVYIVVTNIVVDDTRVNSRPHGAGVRETVPAYRIVMMNNAGDVDVFAGSRDSNYAGKTMKTRGEYGSKHEAPPGKYFGKLRSDGKLGPRVELSDTKKGSSILAPDGTTRDNVQIHVGPGCSEGCVLLTGGKDNRNAFINSLKYLQEHERAAGRSDQIHVVVQPRNERECSDDRCDLAPK